MAEVGSLQVDHSYKRVVESWFPDLVQKEQPKGKASDAGATKRESGKNGSQPESTATISGEKSPLKSPKKKKQTVPMATKIGSLVEGKILPKLKKRQQVQQWEQTESKAPTANSNTTESEDQDSKLNSLSQRKQQGGQPQTGHEMTGQSQGGRKMSRSQIRRMKKRQKKALEQQTAGTQDVPEAVTGQFPTLENLLQSPSKVPQGKAEDIGQNKDKEKSTGKKNNGPKQSPSHSGVNVKVETSSQKQNWKEEESKEMKVSSTSVKVEGIAATSEAMKNTNGEKTSTPHTQKGQTKVKKECKTPSSTSEENKTATNVQPHIGEKKVKKESSSPNTSQRKKDSTGEEISPSSSQVGQKQVKTEPKTSDDDGTVQSPVSQKTSSVNNGGTTSTPGSKKKKVKKEQRSQELSVAESPKSSNQTAEKQPESTLLSSPKDEAKEDQGISPSPVRKNQRKRSQATQKQTSPDLLVRSKPGSSDSDLNKTAERRDLEQKDTSQDTSVLESRKRKRKRRSKSKEPPSEDLAESKDDKADLKQHVNFIQVNLSLTVDAEQVRNAEEDASTPGDGKKKRKRRKAKKVVTHEEQEAPVKPSPVKKPKLQNQPDLLGGAAKQTPEKSTTSVSPVSPTGQKTSPAKKEKKKRKNPLVAEQGSGKKTVEDNIVSNIEETAAKKQRLSAENTEEGSQSTANVATSDAQPTGALKRKRRRARRRKRTSSEQSQSSETGASSAVEPILKEGSTVSPGKPESQSSETGGSTSVEPALNDGGTVSPAKPEDESVTTLSPKTKRKRKKRRR